jgi:hypothetical protein
MSRARVNACVAHPVRTEFGAMLRGLVQERFRTMRDFCEAYGMTAPAVNDRLDDPDKFTVGQLREARYVLGMSAEEMARMVRCLL